MKVFAICDAELNYARRLSEKFAEICGEELFLTQLFDSPEAVLEYHKKTKVDAFCFPFMLFNRKCFAYFMCFIVCNIINYYVKY